MNARSRSWPTANSSVPWSSPMVRNHHVFASVISLDILDDILKLFAPQAWNFLSLSLPTSLLPPHSLSVTLPVSVLKVKVLSAHDKGSHAEVEVKVQKVLSQNTKVKIQRGRVTLYPESWTARGCTCPILNPGRFQFHTFAHKHTQYGWWFQTIPISLNWLTTFSVWPCRWGVSGSRTFRP